jgi:hypothetical protein
MAASPGRRPARPNRTSARRDGDTERLAPEPQRERGALHVVEAPPDLDRAQLLADYDAAMEMAFAEMEHAFLIADGEWPERMRAALARLLEVAATHQRHAELCTMRIFEAEQEGLDRRDVWMSRFMELCWAGYEQSGTAGAPTRLVAPIAAGAVFELIRSHAVEGRLAKLPDALPTATLIVLSPILGRDEALAFTA